MKLKIIVLLIFCFKAVYGVTDKQYAKTPLIFHNDNYDHCMLRGDEALYCLVTYELKPVDPSNISYIWKTIEELSSSDYNYRHDRLRHGVCIPETCPNINTNGNLTEEVNRCYDEKFIENELTGTVVDLICETNESQDPFDWLDISTGIIFIVYIAFVIYATIWEVSALKSSKDDCQKNVLTTRSRIYSAFSIPKNWNRLRYLDSSTKGQKLQVFQGVRFYNMMVVILVHSCMGELYGPVANTKYTEKMHEKFLTLFLASGSLAMGTNFFLSSFLLTYKIYSDQGGKGLKFGKIISLIISRLLRLLPTLIITLTICVIWCRHLGDGPYWSLYYAKEVKYCLKNWWTNLLFLQTIINPNEMCLLHTWYLALDTQFYLMVLVCVWFTYNNPKWLWSILSGLFVFCSCTSFMRNYIRDFRIILLLTPEKIYMMNFIRGNPQWYIQTISFWGHSLSSILGVAMAYLFYKYKDFSFIEKYQNFLTKYSVVLIFGAGIFVTLLPGFLSLRLEIAHNAIWSSCQMTFGRIIFTSVVGVGLVIASRGIGGIIKDILNWTPTVLLGRLSYSAYLIHVNIILIRAGTLRFPKYVSDYSIICNFLSDVTLTYLTALVLCLLFELPFTNLQYLLLQKGNDTVTKKHGSRDEQNIYNDIKKKT